MPSPNGEQPSTSASRRPLKVLAIFHLGEVSGPARSLRPRLEALTREGELEVLAPSEGSLVREYGDIAAVRTLPYEPLTAPRGPAEALAMLRRVGREVRTFRAALRRSRPDLVVVVTTVLPAAALAARLERLPTLLYVGELFANGNGAGPVRAAGHSLVASMSERLADGLVCCSETVAAQFQQPAKSRTIYPGISAEYAHGDGAGLRRRCGLNGEAPLVTVVGNVCTARGQDTAVRALPLIRERLPGAKLLIAGAAHRPPDEAYAAELRRLADELGVADATVFLGFVDRIADVYAASDVVVNPARFDEPFGRAALEALVAGRPVVATRVGAIPEVLREGRDALLVDPEDPAQLADATVRLIENPELGLRLVREGGTRVREEFGDEAGVAAFEEIAAAVLEERRH